MNAHGFVFTERFLLLLLAYKTQQGAARLAQMLTLSIFFCNMPCGWGRGGGEEKEKEKEEEKEKKIKGVVCMCLFVGRECRPQPLEIVSGFPGLLDFNEKNNFRPLLSPFAAHSAKKRKICMFSK